MTEENHRCRTSQTMLRNQFECEGPFLIPIIPKASFNDEDLPDKLYRSRTHLQTIPSGLHTSTQS